MSWSDKIQNQVSFLKQIFCMNVDTVSPLPYDIIIFFFLKAEICTFKPKQKSQRTLLSF